MDGLLGMFIVVLLIVGAIRLSRPHAPWARWRYSARPDKMRRALQRERTLRRPVVRAKLWLQCAIAGTRDGPTSTPWTHGWTSTSIRRRRRRLPNAC
ncbi:integral membrane domain protein [Mycobacterium kansasii]|uniref:Integral membrane domain protein n=1 Tax=Mycobacterium kansasii TaxID=1768 RepID=A0A1V3WN14_MYCKA|nr:integral membrane domain protein [Mycobacterium kansasii]